jgi:hypothetical protein
LSTLDAVDERGPEPVGPPTVVGDETPDLVQGDELLRYVVVHGVLAVRRRPEVEDVAAASRAALDLELDGVLTLAQVVGQGSRALRARDLEASRERHAVSRTSIRRCTSTESTT